MMYFGKQYPKVADDTLGNEFKRMIAPLGTPAAEEVDIIWGKLENVGFGTRFSSVCNTRWLPLASVFIVRLANCNRH